MGRTPRVQLLLVENIDVVVDGEPMATGFSVGVCIYDKRVLDEFGQRMSLQEIGWEDSRECGNVAEGAVDL